MKHPNQWAVRKWKVMNKLMIRFLSLNLIQVEIYATDFLTGFFAQSLYVFFKSKLIVIFYPQKLFTARTWKLLITNIHLMTFFITKKKVKFIWIHFHTVIPKPQSKAFCHTLNFINYLQFWTTTHCKRSVIICITKSIFGLNRKRSQRKILKINGPNIKACGTPCSIFVQLLNVLFIFIFSFRWL